MPEYKDGKGVVNANEVGGAPISGAGAADKDVLRYSSGAAAFGPARLFAGNEDANAKRLVNLADPVDDQDAATKKWATGLIEGLDVKASVRLTSTAADGNITLSGNRSIDGKTTAAGQRVMLKHQTDAKENGIWLAASGAWSRPGDFSVGRSVSKAYAWTEDGDVNGDSGWMVDNLPPTDVVGTDELAIVQFSGAGQITAGTGMSKSGNTLQIGPAGATGNVGGIARTADDIAVAAGPGVDVDSSGKLVAAVDGSTVEVNGSEQIAVKNGGITAAKIADSAKTFGRQIQIDGGGFVIQAAEGVGELVVDRDCTLVEATCYLDVTGSIEVELWKDTYANFPPTAADKISASAPITVSSARKSKDSTLAGWTKDWSEGDVIKWKVNSVSNATFCTIYFRMKRR